MPGQDRIDREKGRKAHAEEADRLELENSLVRYYAKYCYFRTIIRTFQVADWLIELDSKLQRVLWKILLSSSHFSYNASAL